MLLNPTPSLVNLVEAVTTYLGKIYVRLGINSTSTNVDMVISPKGTGAFSLHQANGGSSGGNARGNYSVDLSLIRSTAAQVASGNYAFNAAHSGTASGFYSTNLGYGGTASGSGSFNAAMNGNATTTAAINLGNGGTASGVNSINLGTYGVVNSANGVNTGYQGLVSGVGAVNLAYAGTAAGNYGINLGYYGAVPGTCSINLGDHGVTNGPYSINTGLYGVTYVYGEVTHASGQFTVLGDAQSRDLILRANINTANNATALTSDGSLTPGASNQLILANNQSITASVLVVAKKTETTASTAHFRVTVCASRGATAASTVLHTAPVIEALWNPDAVTLSVTADVTNGGIGFALSTPTMGWHVVAGISAISTIYL